MKRERLWLVAVIGMLLVSAACTPISYVYDPSGRLRGAIDPGADTATYSYDAAGNIVAVDRYGTDMVSVVGFWPVRGPAGSEVVIQGTGFGTEPGDNTVEFSGTPATVLTASATELRVAVPEGATTGPVEVTAPTGSALSSEPFTIEADRVPVVSGMSPLIAAPGDAVTIQGSNFSDDALLDAVVLGGPTYATVTSASSSELAVTVPPRAASGPVSVATPDGSGESNADLFVVPAPYAASEVDFTGRSSLGETTTVTIGTAGHIGLLVFDGEEGQRISVALTNDGFPICQPVATLLGPSGEELGAGTCEPLTNGFVEPATLPTTGTYTVMVTASAAGSVDVTVHEVPDDVAATAAVDGTPVTVATDVPGQNAEVSFAGREGQRMSVQITDETYSSCSPRVRIFAPDDTELVTHICVTTATAGFTEPLALPSTGTYRARIDPIGHAVGSITMALHDVPSDVTGTLVAGGAPVTVDLSVPGQNAELAFDGTNGQRVSIGISDRDFSICNPAMRLLAPDGSEVVANTCPGPTSEIIGPVTLPQDGTYHVVINPSGDLTGSVTLTLHDVPPNVTGELIADGTPVTTDLAVPGQNAELMFDAVAGENLTLEASGDSFAFCSPEVRVFAPDDTEVASDTCVFGSLSLPLGPVPTAGTYRVVVDPVGETTGSITLALVSGAGGAEPQTESGDNDGASGTGDAGDDERSDPGAAGSQDPEGGTAALAMSASAGSVAAISGEVRRTDDVGLAGVTVSADGQETTTDSTGSFTLELPGVQTGVHELTIDGRSANQGGTAYGTFVVGIEVGAGATTELDYTIWMPELDTANAVTLQYPLTDDVVVTHPGIPGLEVHIPAGSEVTDANGDLVTEVGITPLAPGQPPFPLPDGSDPPVLFTIQPGGASIGPEGVRIVYPNEDDEPPGAWVSLIDYSPSDGWHVYGRGEVSGDGAQIVPDAGVAVQRFTGTLTEATSFVAPPDGPSVGNGNYPVDLATGLFVHETTDLAVSDLVPISLSRTYRPDDPASRAFGVGSALSFDLSLWTGYPYEEAELVLPDGAVVTYERTSGTSYRDAVFEHTTTPTGFQGSTITWNGESFELALKDGTTLVFGINAPLQSIRDRRGNEVLLEHAGRNLSGAGVGNVAAIHSPTGRWIELVYDSEDRIVEASDHVGRTVTYAYDTDGRLATVTNAAGGQTAYGYDGDGRLHTITDPRGVTALTVDYDSDGRVIQQTAADGSTYSFAYTTDAEGQVTRTEVTDAGGLVRRVDFVDGYWVTDTAAVGTPEEQALTVEREAGTRLITASIDPTGRRTAYTYDAFGNQTSVTRLAGTPFAVTTTTAYEPNFHQVASTTDSLGRTATYAYDEWGNLVSATDPAGAETTYAYDEAGRLAFATDPLGNTTEHDYELLHRFTVTGPLGHSAAEYHDAAGRPAVLTGPLGNRTRRTYDALDQLTATTGPDGAETTFGYDPVGNLASVTDPEGNTTTYTYDDLGRADTRTDPLGATESLGYDTAGNLTQHTDQRGLVTTFVYDPLGRVTNASFGVTDSGSESTIDYTYDTAGRLTEVDDSAYGIINLGYDGLDRLTSETTPQGQITYGYDQAGQRTSMAIAGGPTTNYGYDTVGALTSVTQGALTATATRDPLGRVTEMGLPNGVTATYGYDAASQLTAITYTAAGAAEPLGDLSYTYDPAGRRVTASGSLARTSLPEQVTAADHDAGNRLTSRDGTTFTYDDAGNLTSDGTSTYTWDARGQLTQVNGPVTASFDYDPFGRRTTKTVDGTTTTYLYDGANIIEQAQAGSSTTYLTGLAADETLARSNATGTTTYLTDALGSTLGLVDATGAIATSYTYDPHGATTAEGAPDPNPFAFTGRELDETGLYYYRARYYQPETGRFISQDPIGFNGGQANLYAYAGNDPLNTVDPTGLCGVDLTIDIFATLDRINWWSLGPDGFIAQVAADPSVVDDLTAEITGLVVAHCAVAVAGAVGGPLGVSGLADDLVSSGRYTRTSFGGNRVYQRSDLIDPNIVDSKGRTNLQRMRGRIAPIGPDGRSLQLHHLTQRQSGAIAEITATMHQRNSGTLHINPNTIPSGIDRPAFRRWRGDYWAWRANDF